MKLKLSTLRPESLTTTISLFAHKPVILHFSQSELVIALPAQDASNPEPLLWARIAIRAVFDHIDIASLRENKVLLEANPDLLLQTLRNYERANLDSLNIRLQRQESSEGAQSTRAASLAFYYTITSAKSTRTINHTFRIPVKVLKLSSMSEPQLPNCVVACRLPPRFQLAFRRLDKFKRTPECVLLVRVVSGDNTLGLVVADEAKYRITIAWNDPIVVFVPKEAQLGRDLRHEALRRDPQDKDSPYGVYEVAVKLRDWQSAQKIVAACHTTVLALSEKDCVLQCLLEDSQDIVIVYCLNGICV